MPEAILQTEDMTETFTAAAAQQPGDILLARSGRVGVVQGSRALAINDVGSLDVGQRVYEVPVEASYNPASGAIVGWDDTEKEVVAPADADFILGRVQVGGLGAGVSVKVRFNDVDKQVANVAALTVTGTDEDGTARTGINAILTALKAAGIMVAD